MKIDARPFPYIRSSETVQLVTLDMILALIPPFFMAYFYYGARALYIGVVSVLTSVLANWLSSVCNGHGVEWWDMSPVVTGMLIALMMPAAVPFYVPITAAVFAILVAKFPYGGTGQNLFNPAAAGLVFVNLCFTNLLTSYTTPLEPLSLAVPEGIKLIQGSASVLKMGGVPTISTMELMLGNFAGPMGTTNILVIAACLIYLLVRKNVKWTLPLSYLITVSLFAAMIHHDNISAWESVVLELVSGSLMFIAVFMLTEPVTQPKRSLAKILYGALAGFLTMMFRYYGYVLNGAVFALLLTNAFAPMLDRLAEWLFERERRSLNEAE